MKSIFLLLSAVSCSSLAFAATELPSPPPTAKQAVKTTYHGVDVTEDYRWLEDAQNPDVKAWVGSQNKYTRAYLDKLPSLPLIKKRLTDLNSKSSPDYFQLSFSGKKLFALKFQPPKNQPLLITLDSADKKASEKVLLDLNQLDPSGKTSIDFYKPTRDGTLVAVSLSEGGTESGTVRIYNTLTHKELSDRVPRVNGGTAGGSVAWNNDNTGFFYTRYPRGSERPKEDMDFYQQIYFHKLGTNTEADTYALGKDFPRIAEIAMITSDNGKYTLADVANGDGGEHAHYLYGPNHTWTQLTKFSDQVKTIEFSKGDTAFLLSRNGAPRGKILSLSLASPTISLDLAKTIVPESDVTIEGFTVTDSLLYSEDLEGGPSAIRVFDFEGKPKTPVSLPPISSAKQLVALDGDTILFRGESYVSPAAWYRFTPGMTKAVRTALYRTSAADFSGYEAVRSFATSKDGTKVPVNIIRKKGRKLDGTSPTILTAYGGYGISLSPRFSVGLITWLEQGGVYAIANIRGGGEFGEAWHLGGNLANKQNVFDDFAAAAELMVQDKYTNAQKLVIEGGSNGGLLMGAALTQHPEYYKAVVSHVGIYDMLRVELHPNGAFNVTEFGTVKDPALFKAMYAYSPYHRVKDKTAYPAVLFLTGDNDPRVDPANSRKMTARLQAATGSKAPILLRTTADAGHGGGTPLKERIAASSDVYAFMFDQLGVSYKPVSTKK